MEMVKRSMVPMAQEDKVMIKYSRAGFKTMELFCILW